MKFIIGFQKGMKSFGQLISTLINSVLLLVVYVLGFGLTSIFAKVLKKHFLETKQTKTTYWSDLNLKKQSINHYYKQF